MDKAHNGGTKPPKIINSHAELINQILLEYGNGDVRLWKAHNGISHDKNGKVVGYIGKRGQADISGLLRGGYRIEIEGKFGRDKQNEAQKHYELMITAFGGLYILARDLGGVEDGIQKYLLTKDKRFIRAGNRIIDAPVREQLEERRPGGDTWKY